MWFLVPVAAREEVAARLVQEAVCLAVEAYSTKDWAQTVLVVPTLLVLGPRAELQEGLGPVQHTQGEGPGTGEGAVVVGAAGAAEHGEMLKEEDAHDELQPGALRNGGGSPDELVSEEAHGSAGIPRVTKSCPHYGMPL